MVDNPLLTEVKVDVKAPVDRLGCISGHTPDPDFALIANSNLNQDNSLAFLITLFFEPTTYKQAMQAFDANK